MIDPVIVAQIILDSDVKVQTEMCASMFGISLIETRLTEYIPTDAQRRNAPDWVPTDGRPIGDCTPHVYDLFPSNNEDTQFSRFLK